MDDDGSIEDGKGRGGCRWLMVEHDIVTADQVLKAISNACQLMSTGYVYFKFEPFVLHVACRDLCHAQLLV
jgi:tRNA wybutosine-synthesizing protein 3